MPGRTARSLFPQPAGRRHTIGLLTTGFAYGPERRLLEGMLAATQGHRVNLLSFHGCRLNSPAPADRRANVIYDLIDRHNCDALAVWSGALGEFVTADEFHRFCSRSGLPVVTIAGTSFDDIPSLVFDFYTGMRSQMLHLVDVHRFERIAFVRGLSGQDEAEQRFRAYRDVLQERGIDHDERLVVPGDFQRESGKRAVRTLFDERQVLPQAIVAVNDETALGVLEELSARGARVPDEVALVGFDDDDAGRWTNPPLTTVRFSIDDAAERALDILLSALNGTPSVARHVLSLDPVIRASCGCTAHAPVDSGAPASAELSRSTFIARAIGELEYSSPLAFVTSRASDWVARVYDALAVDVRDSSQTSLGAWESVLHESLLSRPVGSGLLGHDVPIASQLEATAWHDILEVLQSRLFANPDLTATQRTHGQMLLWKASRMIVAHGQRLPTFGGWEREQHIWQVQEIGHRLLHSFDVAALAQVAAEALPAIGIDRFAISLYDKDDKSLQTSRLLVGSNEARISLLPNATPGARSPTFASSALAPAGFFRGDAPYAYAVEPLVFEEHQIGFALFGIHSAAQGTLVAALRKQLSAALEGAVLVDQLEQRAHELEQAHKIQEEQRQRLLIAERMAWLGRLTAGVAHEMNTPVAAVRSSLSHLSDLIEEYQSSIGDDGVLPDDHRDLAREMRESVMLANRAAQSAAKFVAEFKAQTRDLAPKTTTVFNAVPLVSEAQSLLKHVLDSSSSGVDYRPESDFINVAGTPGRFAQVVSNLLVNAADAMLSRGGGTIVVCLGSTANAVSLTVVDQGEGIADEVMPRIFEPMFSTRNFGQHIGLGLTIARDIVESEFGGTIEVTSQVGSGTTVRVTLPKPE
ncbi:MAG TPA: substrate-binding domain-containing protein [Polyangiaceae bacterium]|nr:substrate-binding domain-containing protein [Polyangiaceae bacterium]